MATPNPNFIGYMSSDELWYKGETNICLTDVVEETVDKLDTMELATLSEVRSYLSF